MPSTNEAATVAAAATSPAPVAAKPAKPARVVRTKPVAKPEPKAPSAVLGADAASRPSNLAPKAAKPSAGASKPATANKPADTKAADATYRGATRDAAGIVRNQTNFDQYSTRDSAYLAFFGNVARAVKSDTITLKQIHDNGAARDTSAKRYNPNYTGSAKATDVGAINRLCADGYFTKSADGHSLTATDKAKQSKAYANT